MNSILMENQFNFLLENNTEENEIVLKGLDVEHNENKRNETDIADATVDDLSSMIVSHMMQAVKEDLAKPQP